MNGHAIAANQGILCARCDTPNASDAPYCVGCGAALRPVAPPVAPAAAPAKPRCAVCGITSPASARYCVNCGHELGAAAPASYGPLAAHSGGTRVGETLVQHIYVNMPPAQAEIPLLIRAVWFFCVGLWAGQIWLVAAWLLNLTVIGLPLGIWMLNRLPQVMTLRTQPARQVALAGLGSSSASFAVRLVYFVLIGWWVSLLWLELAWLAAISLLGLPLSFLMFERVATITTLAES